MKYESLFVLFSTILFLQPGTSSADQFNLGNITNLGGKLNFMQTITYTRPKHKSGMALDWCKVFEGQCGKPAADAFCKSKGHLRASAWPQLANPGVKTMTFSQNAVCNPQYHRCDTFAKITCVKKPKVVKVFSVPRHKGFYLDWCRVFEGQCGKPAAQAFCKSRGYKKVINFKKRNHAPGKTMTISQNAVCNPQYHRCDTFKWIKCIK